MILGGLLLLILLQDIVFYFERKSLLDRILAGSPETYRRQKEKMEHKHVMTAHEKQIRKWRELPREEGEKE